MGKIILITLFGFWYVINLYNCIRNRFYGENYDIDGFLFVNTLALVLGVIALIVTTWNYIPFQ